MTTLHENVSISSLAGVLHAAMALGPQLWNGKAGDDAGAANTPTPSDLSRDLLELFARLNAARVPYVLVGAVALLKYIEGRNTDHVDLIVALESLHRLPDLKIEDRTDEIAKARFGSLRVDLLFTSNPVFRLVQHSHATTHHFGELSVPCATVEGLVLLKLYALPSLYRQSLLQRAALYETDIAMLCQRHHPQIAPLLEVLRPYIGSGEFQELSRIAQETSQRVERMNRSKP